MSAGRDQRLSEPIDAQASIGHVNLKVADLARALRFWRDALGFVVRQQSPGAAFLGAGGYHHHIALNIWDSRNGPPSPKGAAGLHHVAIRFPDRAALIKAARRMRRFDAPIEGAFDHGVGESLYTRDPDGNGVELTYDRPCADWPRGPSSGVAMTMRPIALEALLGSEEEPA